MNREGGSTKAIPIITAVWAEQGTASRVFWQSRGSLTDRFRLKVECEMLFPFALSDLRFCNSTQIIFPADCFVKRNLQRLEIRLSAIKAAMIIPPPASPVPVRVSPSSRNEANAVSMG